MKSKYIVLAITLLLTLSSTSTIYAASSKGTIVSPGSTTKQSPSVDMRGPRINQIDFEVVAADSALASTLGTGGIQAAEWSFLAGSYASLKSNANIKESKTLGYTFDGLAMNIAQPIISSVHYREAIEYLTNYASIQSVSLSGIAGTASPYLMPCANYPTVCNTKVPLENYNLKDAAEQLSMSGLTVMYNGAPITTAGIGALSNSKLSGLSYTLNGKTWSPLFYYRNDDPLRTSVATLLVSAAKLIGFTINAVGISDEEAGGTIYGSSEGDVVTDGGYCASGPNAGYDDCPKAVVNETASALAADNWDMYTFGWVTSASFTFQGAYEWISSQVNNDNFNAYINSTMDYYGNQVLYASTLSAAGAAAEKVGLIFAQSLPSIVSFYQNYLYADYINGWTGFVGEPTTGPNTGVGAYWTFMNVHPTSCTTYPCGTLSYGTHGIAAIGSLNPIAYPNWVWQADIYGEIYDTPLATPINQPNIPNAYAAYMLQGTDPDAPAGSVACVPASGVGITGCQVAPYSGLTPAGSFNFQKVDGSSGVGVQSNIVNGQAITFTFAKNITFTDNVPVTAYDYNYSLYALNVAISPDLPTAFSPYIGGDAGPLGLWATTVGNGGYSITMYMNDTSVWNVLDVTVPVLPEHIFNFLNINVADAVEAQIDFSQPYNVATGAVSGSTQGTAPAYVSFLNNINLASGPFWLFTINEATGSGILDRNVNYFRSAWYQNLGNPNAKGTSFTITSYPAEYIYNSGSATNMSIGSKALGWVNMTSANLQASNGGNAKLSGMTCTATAIPYVGSASNTNFKLKSEGTPSTLTATCSGNGQIVVSIGKGTLAKGIYEIIVQGTYTFLGEARTWYQFYGIDVT